MSINNLPQHMSMEVQKADRYWAKEQHLVVSIKGRKVQLMYQMQQTKLLHLTSAILAFFTPQESQDYGYHLPSPFLLKPFNTILSYT
jgi:hypothetical protein